MEDKDGNVLEDEVVTEAFDASIIEECFIATAAFGSNMEPGVVLLRQFRDTKLLTNILGQAFVSFYYSVSPGIAEQIAGSALLKTVTQVLLLPVIAAAWLLLHPALLYPLLLLLLVAYIINRQRMAVFKR